MVNPLGLGMVGATSVAGGSGWREEALPGPAVPQSFEMLAVVPGCHRPCHAHQDTTRWWAAQSDRLAARLGLS
ncbi:hypothetical protein [Gordonia sp. (in: high G+C Gram-positive bacteria)]|jgi:hypothetical protein|uniref:hypothetical protein n=1 Tax=Gordonia sp. (in: high G+C Gram-positive bacteria) TaxID=84139 RepID=UPI001E02A295|nr:hypothetical protein [Gordonia sp. (in: high G+C Gram-positive bacteria)]MCB1293627.1 hypothetical protein [Gordonia sp. (in: high G+C Gram-positive bacteria)]HMS74170.1 hypothetical protein [Gordonia sp. (in: high G+C Gram-positive bacteria)]